MKNKNFILFFFLLKFSIGYAARVLVTETTLKVNGSNSEELFFGFDKGDQIVFNLSMLKGKHLKEVEIFDAKGSSLFMDYKTKRIKDKFIAVKKRGIYRFKFKNRGLGVRVVRIKIERIPKDESLDFNSIVYWKMRKDTSFFDVNERYLDHIDTTIVKVLESTVKIHSAGNFNGNKTVINYNLPKNTVSWSYYLGVNQEGQKVLLDAEKELVEKATPVLSSMPGYGPLGALALGFPSFIARLQAGEDIDFRLVVGENANLWQSNQPYDYIKTGKIINDFAQMAPISGDLSFCFSNDNAIQGVIVLSKVVAITATEIWASRKVNKMRVQSKKIPYLDIGGQEILEESLAKEIKGKGNNLGKLIEAVLEKKSE